MIEDMIRDVAESAIEQRSKCPELPPYAIVDLGQGPGQCALLPFDQAGGVGVEWRDLLWAAGAMCRREGALRCFVVMEGTGKVVRTQAAALELMRKYPTPLDIPADDRERFLFVSEVRFLDPESSPVARIGIHGFGADTRFDPPVILKDHICSIFHPVYNGWKSGKMPPGLNMASEAAPPDL